MRSGDDNLHDQYHETPTDPAGRTERCRTESVVYTDHGRDALRAQTVPAGNTAVLTWFSSSYCSVWIFPMLSDVPHIIH